MVLAFSLQSDVKSIGAYAGFAAIIGLALLVLLYFAQAREVRRLSDLLEQQEDRLRGQPASARQLMPRPVVAPAGREVPTPQVSQVQPAAAASTATVAVPGVRRVAVGGAPASGGGGAEALTATGGAGEVGTTAVPAPAAPVAAATVAGAMAAASAAPTAVTGDSSSGADAAPPAPAAPGEDAESAGRGDGSSIGEAAGSGGGGSAEPSTPSASVPLVARPAATAEPVGPAQLLDQAVAAPGGGDVSLDTAENAIVEGLGSSSPPQSQSADPEVAEALGSGAVAVAALEPEPAGEISAERIEPSVFDFSAQPALGDDDEQVDDRPAADPEEAPPLAPSTAAGARPRFPPPPPTQARALPVAAAATAGGAALGDAAEVGAATTRRRERPADPDGDDVEMHAGGSVLRLLAAAVVIVAVLIFIATKVLGGGGSNAPRPIGPSPSTVTVAVLNGTHATGLATQVAGRLAHLGFKQGTIGNALSHGHHYTLVSYTTPAGLAAAKEVAKDLGPPSTTRVGPADAATAAIAEAGGGQPQVVVTLGSKYKAR
jgi:hypothetical protein